MIASRARGQSQVKPSAGLQFRFEAKHKVYIGRLCWCLCKNYKQIFLVSEDSGAVLVSEDSGAADVGDPCAQPDPRVLRFISAADFKQGLKRTNEVMKNFAKRPQPLWVQFIGWGSLALILWNILARGLVSEYPNWALAVGWVVAIGSCIPLLKFSSKLEAELKEMVETALKELWKNAVAQGVEVDFENEHSSSGDDNTWYPAALTITLPNGERGAVSAIEASTVDV